ncbi:MAG: hypothetical protein NZ703_08100 [Gemmataceae bacterium]|nr:hypothetical protein [Gemmataceae bacterium]MDW8244818.1 hypothetical protein [Thermogemmata sp.]
MDPSRHGGEGIRAPSEASGRVHRHWRLLDPVATAESNAPNPQEPTGDTPRTHAPVTGGSGSLPTSLTNRLKPPSLPTPPAAGTLGTPPVEAAMNTPISRPHLLRRPTNSGIHAPNYATPVSVPSATAPADYHSYALDDDLQAEILRVRQDNKELRKVLEEVKVILEEAQDTEKKLRAQLEEYEKLLAEKEEQIQQLGQQLAEVEQQITSGELVHRSRVPKTRSELEEWADELEREEARLTQERKRLEEERRQLQEDEKALEDQMRHNEVQMARERALLARQRQELERLYEEIRLKLDSLQRSDAAQQELITHFRRRAQDTLHSSQQR